MNTEQIDITLGVSLILGDVTNLLLYTKKTTSDGKEYIADRELPFRLRYRLNKNRMLFEKDSAEFQRQRLFALAKYGESTPDGKNVIINDPQKQELFKQELSSILDTPVSHSIVRIEPEDIDLVTDTDIQISPDAMALFIGYMTNDPELQKDLDTKINLRITTPSIPQTQTEQTEAQPTQNIEQTPTTEETPKVEEVVEAPKAEEPVKTEEAPVKKTTAKKTSTTKKSTTAKTTSTAKKTSTKKTTETATSEKTEETPKKTTTRKPRTKKVEE